MLRQSFFPVVWNVVLLVLVCFYSGRLESGRQLHLVQAFTAAIQPRQQQRWLVVDGEATQKGSTSTSTTATTTGLSMVPLSNEEIFARAQERKAAEEAAKQEPYPMLYDYDMLQDMQAALLLMERRVKEGPQSLSLQDVDQLHSQLNKILHEMKLNEHQRPPRPKRESGESASMAAPTTNMNAAPPSVVAAAQPRAPSSTSAPAPTSATRTTTTATPDGPRVEQSYQAGPKVIDMDTPADEGAEYNGYGGMGQAAGTRNTYIIPGMDEMSPEEYQRELQRSVIEQQAQRKRSGVTGNRSTWDYLNQLNGGTHLNVLKPQPEIK